MRVGGALGRLLPCPLLPVPAAALLHGRPATASSLALAFAHRLLTLWCERHPPGAS
jgi:hypothetical protein